MDYAYDTTRRSLGRGLLLLLITGALAGCGSQASRLEDIEGADDTADRVCPSCGASAGGETGDFGGDIAACANAYVVREVDRSEADALGFDATVAVRTIEEPIDEPMTWAAIDDSEDGAPARGYDAETRVQLTLTVGELTFHELDLDECGDDFYCRQEGERGLCADRYVMVSASGELHTSDGAIAATLPLQDVRILKPDTGNLSVAAWVDLRDVTGSLELAPAFPGPYLGLLALSLQYTSDRALQYGVLDIMMHPDRQKLLDELFDSDGGLGDDGGLEFPKPRYYRPLQGRWGSPPPIPTGSGGPPQP